MHRSRSKKLFLELFIREHAAADNKPLKLALIQSLVHELYKKGAIFDISMQYKSNLSDNL